MSSNNEITIPVFEKTGTGNIRERFITLKRKDTLKGGFKINRKETCNEDHLGLKLKYKNKSRDTLISMDFLVTEEDYSKISDFFAENKLHK